MSHALADSSFSRSRRSYRFGILATIAAVAVGWLVYSGMRTTSVYYWQVSELQEMPASALSQQVRIAGKVVPGSISRDPDGSTVRFLATDGTGEIPIVYSSVIPDIFGDNIEVVVEGKYAPSGEFQAQTLLAKCPSKFESAPQASTGPGGQ